jgi:hypothetical protein
MIFNPMVIGTTARINHNSADYYDSKLYADLPATPDQEPDRELPSELENKIILGDAQNMEEIPNNSIHQRTVYGMDKISMDNESRICEESRSSCSIPSGITLSPHTIVFIQG